MIDRIAKNLRELNEVVTKIDELNKEIPKHMDSFFNPKTQRLRFRSSKICFILEEYAVKASLEEWAEAIKLAGVDADRFQQELFWS